jgi:hypothetical protein
MMKLIAPSVLENKTTRIPICSPPKKKSHVSHRVSRETHPKNSITWFPLDITGKNEKNEKLGGCPALWLLP